MKILIGGAWPYANYKLHLGHVAGLIGGDLLARYHRAKGDDVLYVSGSDCHGTPITERARFQEIAVQHSPIASRMAARRSSSIRLEGALTLIAATIFPV